LGTAAKGGYLDLQQNCLSYDPGSANLLLMEALEQKGVHVYYGGLSSACAVTIIGHVYCTCDSSPIAGATVQIGNYSATTDNGGSYSINGILSGTYSATVSQANYVTTNTTVIIPSAVSTTTEDFTLNPNGRDIAQRIKILNGSLRAQTAGPKSSDGLDTTKEILFQPEPASGLTLKQAACFLGYDHFNWFQEVVLDPHYLYFSAQSHYVDPPQIRYNHWNFVDCTPNNNGIPTQNMLCLSEDVTGNCISSEPADNSPLYWNESSFSQNDPYYWGYNVSNDGTIFKFSDQPFDNCLQAGQKRVFNTWLVGVKSSGFFDFLFDGFYWESTYQGSGGSV
jgi:hypothetical protein